MIAARYLERNPDLPVFSAMQQIPDHGAAAKVYPITLHPRFELLAEVGQFTWACGITFYHGSLFVAEPVHNLAHQDLLTDAGATFIAKRAHPDVEFFLASTDAWFRPVNFYVGPDGVLYVMDRQTIDHYGGYYPYAGQVKLDTKVRDAEVFINGAFAGTTREAGVTKFTERVYVVPGKTLHLHPTL